jgi:hypothetical protein
MNPATWQGASSTFRCGKAGTSSWHCGITRQTRLPLCTAREGDSRISRRLPVLQPPDNGGKPLPGSCPSPRQLGFRCDAGRICARTVLGGLVAIARVSTVRRAQNVNSFFHRRMTLTGGKSAALERRRWSTPKISSVPRSSRNLAAVVLRQGLCRSGPRVWDGVGLLSPCTSRKRGFIRSLPSRDLVSPRPLALHNRLDAFVVPAEQRKHGRDVHFIPDVEANPSRIRHVMMRRNFAAGHELIADRSWKRKIGDVTAVEVADFNLAHAKSAPAETMPARSYVRPTQQFAFDGFTDFNSRFHFQFSVDGFREISAITTI